MNKKTLIISISVIALLFIAAAILSRVSPKKQPIIPADQQTAATLPSDQSNQTSNQPIGQQSGQTSGNLPAKTPRDNTIRVNDTNNTSQIKDSYAKYLSQDISKFPDYVTNGISQDYPLSDKNGKMVDLDIFLKTAGANINPKLRDVIGSNFYSLFYCPDSSGHKEYGVTFDIESSDANAAQKNNTKAKDSLHLWEPFMLKDLHSILFPQVNFSDSQLNQTLTFNDGTTRYAEITLPDGKSSINYFVKDPPDNRIYISSSRACLQKALNNLFDF